jgi:hypothetical protein
MTEPKKVGSSHIKFWVKDNGFHIEVIGFGMEEYLTILRKQDMIDLVYTPQLDTWENRNTVILKMEDVKLRSERQAESGLC